MNTEKRNPAGGPGSRGAGKALGSNVSSSDYTPLAQAAAKALARELSIVLLAADRMAAGHALAWSDHDRLHAAHQHIIRVLADLIDREVLQ